MQHTSSVTEEKPTVVQANFRLPEDLKKTAEHLCIDFGLSWSEFCHQAVAAHVAKLEAQFAAGDNGAAGPSRPIAKPPAKQA